MTTTAGVFEEYTKLFADLPETLDVVLEDISVAVSMKTQYVFGFLGLHKKLCEGTIGAADLADVGANELKRDQLRKYAAMETADFAKVLFDIATQKGKFSKKALTIHKYTLRAVYVLYQVEQLLQWQRDNFAHVAQNKGINALAFINSGTLVTIDNKTHKAKIIVNDVTFEIESYQGGVSTAALMLNDMFLHFLVETGSASLQVDLREIARLKGRSTSSKAIYKLHQDVVAWMKEIANIKYRCRERINGKWVESGEIKINGGTSFIKNGIVYWNFNADLTAQLALLAPMDYPTELWKADPRTNVFYFGRYIAQNYRLNEGKKGRERIPIRTLIDKSPNLPTYEEVMRGNRNVSDRIVRKTFADLDALDHVFYTVEREDGTPIDDPASLDYDTFIAAYIVIDYSDYPSHTQRLANQERRQKRIQAAKERKQAEDAAKGEV